MKTVMFTLTATVLLFTACSKTDLSEADSGSLTASSFSTQASGAPGSYVSDWMRGLQWNVSDSSDYKIYASSHEVPSLNAEVLSGGAVLVFVKNIPMVDGSILARPMLTPFHVLPSVGRPGYDQMWYNVNSVGKIVVKYRTNKHKYGPPELPDNNVEVKYFIISGETLTSLGYTPATITRLRYDDLVDLLGSGG